MAIHNLNADFSTGADGYPSFFFSAKTEASAPAQQYFRKLSTDFSILVHVRPHKAVGGFLFAVVSPVNSIVQLGLEVSESESATGVAATDVTLYYTDYRSAKSSSSLAVFTVVPEMVNRWTLLAVRVRGEDVTLYDNCNFFNEIRLTRKRTPELTFDNGSTFYLGQRGSRQSRKFEVTVMTVTAEEFRRAVTGIPIRTITQA